MSSNLKIWRVRVVTQATRLVDEGYDEVELIEEIPCDKLRTYGFRDGELAKIERYRRKQLELIEESAPPDDANGASSSQAHLRGVEHVATDGARTVLHPDVAALVDVVKLQISLVGKLTDLVEKLTEQSTQ